MLWPTTIRILVDLLGRAPSEEETAALKAAWDATENLPYPDRRMERLKALLRFLADYIDDDGIPREHTTIPATIDQSDWGVTTAVLDTERVEIKEGAKVRILVPLTALRLR